MQLILDFLSANPILGICLCLAIGYSIGFIRIGSFTVGATIGTLLVGFVLSRFASFEIPGILLNLFLLLFCFTVGYEAGPAFFRSLRSNGVKFVLHAIVFSVSALLVLYAVALTGLFDRDTLIGMAAGALTQTSILTVVDGLGDMSSIAYAVTYTTGTLLPIIFVPMLAPKLIRTTPIMAAKQKLTKQNAGRSGLDEAENVRFAPLFPRAYCVTRGASYIGRTIEDLEADFGHSLEVVKLFRKEKELSLSQGLVIAENDVLTVISTAEHMIALDDEYMCEVSCRQYLSLSVVSKEIIVTEDVSTPLANLLNTHGIVFRGAVTKNGKKLRDPLGITPTKGMLIKVSGVDTSIAKLAEQIGYVKEIGTTTDVPFVFSALAISIVLGAFKILGFGLGDSTCALIIGLVCGWYCNKNPKYGVYPESTRWFMKNVGLNLFIAAKALSTKAFSFDTTILMILGIGLAVTLLPHILTLLFCKYALRMDDADNLGGLCGSGTITPALNGLIDAAGSSVFTASYATTNAVANILLTVLGVVFAALL